MEPLNAVARLAADDQSAEVWEGTQAPDASRDAVAKALGFTPEQGEGDTSATWAAASAGARSATMPRNAR